MNKLILFRTYMFGLILGPLSRDEPARLVQVRCHSPQGGSMIRHNQPPVTATGASWEKDLTGKYRFP